MSYQSGRQAFFLPADGIEPEVIGADIGIYVGRNAQVQLDRVRMYESHDCRYLTEILAPQRIYHPCPNRLDNGRQYVVRNRLLDLILLAQEMIADMKADSMRWQTERSHSRGEGKWFR